MGGGGAGKILKLLHRGGKHLFGGFRVILLVSMGYKDNGDNKKQIVDSITIVYWQLQLIYNLSFKDLLFKVMDGTDLLFLLNYIFQICCRF